jgi:hypothetical protein
MKTNKIKIVGILISIFLLSLTMLSSDSGDSKYITVHQYTGEIRSVWFKNNEYVICHIGFGESGVVIRNKTKDDLEIELLRLQIKKLKSNE